VSSSILRKLRQSSNGLAGGRCFIRSWFFGALAHADDVALIACPLAAAWGHDPLVVSTCDSFAARFDVLHV
jgi:hypothetical protein